MKTLYNKTKKITLLLATGFLLTLPAFVNANEFPVITIAGSATKIIKEHVKFPDFDVYKGQIKKINVVFTVNEAGNVNLVIANTTNAQLKKSIEEQFLKLTLKQLKADNAYSIQFNFKTL